MSKNKNDDWLQEFKQFTEAEPIVPSAEASQSILNKVRADLCPPIGKLATKLILIHAFATLAVVSFCPQLGVGPFVSHGFGHLFMEFGPVGCAAGCAAILFTTSGFLISALLSRDELRIATKHGVRNISALVAVSFMALVLSGGAGDFLEFMGWIAGGWAGGMIALRLIAAARLSTR